MSLNDMCHIRLDNTEHVPYLVVFSISMLTKTYLSINKNAHKNENNMRIFYLKGIRCVQYRLFKMWGIKMQKRIWLI